MAESWFDFDFDEDEDAEDDDEDEQLVAIAFRSMGLPTNEASVAVVVSKSLDLLAF